MTAKFLIWFLQFLRPEFVLRPLCFYYRIIALDFWISSINFWGRLMDFRCVTISDYDRLMELWNSVGMSRRALNPVDDSREGIGRYLARNPATCFCAVDGETMCGVILSGHDGRRGIIHHMCVNPDFRRKGIASRLVDMAERALKAEGIQKVFGLVFKDNDDGNAFWESRGYSLRTNLNYRNKSLNAEIPQGE